MNNDIYIKNAKRMAARVLSEFHKSPISSDDVFIVWFCKTLQNWKAIVSTNVVHYSDYIEVTYNGDRDETYVDVYDKQMNLRFKGDTEVDGWIKEISVESE